MREKHDFEIFLSDFIPKVEEKSCLLNKARWLLETTGSRDAADLRTALDTELRLFFHDREVYEKLRKWDSDTSLQDPLLKRQLKVLLFSFQENMSDKALIEKISEKESALSLLYASFRPELDGKKLSENDIRELLKKENDVGKRKKVWEASKEIGDVLAPRILELVTLRNEEAKSLGYPDYFRMQLALQEVDEDWLMGFLDLIAKESDKAYDDMLDAIGVELSKRFQVGPEEIGPWAWSEPFCQEDPLGEGECDSLVKDVDICQLGKVFFEKMGMDVGPILARSDMYERPGKNQHAFCMHIDRKGDIRTLNNVKSSIKWLEVVLHELGHAVYDLGINPNLPWLLRQPPHMLTTEAMALISGRQAYRYHSLKELLGTSKEKEGLMRQADQSLRRRQLIFSRWVLVMTFFERELYRNPGQDLNRLWWKLVEKYQKIPSSQREGKNDWAAKYHVGLAPVYYFSYLLGEVFASEIEETLSRKTGSRELSTKESGLFLQESLFYPGNSMSWDLLVRHVTGKSLSHEAWIDQFAKAAEEVSIQ